MGWSRFWGRTRIRRYLWNHFAILGDRFEYRGRGIELMVGFVLALLMLAGWGGLMYLVWIYVFHERPFASFGLFDIFSLSVALIGFPLGLCRPLRRPALPAVAHALARHTLRAGGLGLALRRVGHLPHLRQRHLTGQLLTPVVSVNLARPRIANTRFGSLPFVFGGSAGDIYGRYLGYYFLNIIAWLVAAVIFFAAIGGAVGGLGISFTEEELRKLFTRPSLRTILVVAALAIGVYIVFSLLILPLRCWWQAYLFRYLVSHSRAGNVLFATAISTRQMWGFLVLNYLIIMLTLGLGWPWVMHRTLRLIAAELWLYGAPDGASIRQPTDLGPRYGEGLLDMFDVSGV